MDPIQDDDRPETEADHTSETRFGPRPVPEGHHVPHATLHSRRVPPTGHMSPDGRSAYPNPDTSTKIVVWGGVALGVAGGTAAAIFAIRKIADAISHDEPSRPQIRHHWSPRFANMDDDEQEAVRRRVRAQDRADREEAARLRAEAARRRSSPRKKRKGNFAEGLIETSTRLSDSLQGVTKSMAVAIESFLGVAGQATEIVHEFADAADQLRSALRGENQPRTPHETRHDDHDRTHRL